MQLNDADSISPSEYLDQVIRSYRIRLYEQHKWVVDLKTTADHVNAILVWSSVPNVQVEVEVLRDLVLCHERTSQLKTDIDRFSPNEHFLQYFIFLNNHKAFIIMSNSYHLILINSRARGGTLGWSVMKGKFKPTPFQLRNNSTTTIKVQRCHGCHFIKCYYIVADAEN